MTCSFPLMQDSGVRGKVEAMHLDLSSFRHVTHHALECTKALSQLLPAYLPALYDHLAEQHIRYG